MTLPDVTFVDFVEIACAIALVQILLDPLYCAWRDRRRR